MKVIGYFVVESAEDFEQVLTLDTSKGFPKGGILNWPGKTRTLFPDRESAKKAIDRTEHYRLAFGENYPERKSCKIVPVTGSTDGREGA